VICTSASQDSRPKAAIPLPAQITTLDPVNPKRLLLDGPWSMFVFSASRLLSYLLFLGFVDGSE